ncbi:uncharacterized protein METZ01_LOCUS114781, partial [marine metagenome]
MDKLIEDLKKVVGQDYVLSEKSDLMVYEYDGSVDKAFPILVVLPSDANEVSKVVKLAQENNLPIVARGAGTGLSGGAIAEKGGIVIAMSRINRILEVDETNRIAVVEPGVVNLDLSLHT